MHSVLLSIKRKKNYIQRLYSSFVSVASAVNNKFDKTVIEI